MKKHILKTVNPFFQDLWEERKTFEIRINDRDYEVGDTLILEEYDRFTEAVEVRKELGWKSVKKNGEWIEMCASCKEEMGKNES